MKIFEGKAHSAKLDEYIKRRLNVSKPRGKLLIVLIGDNQISQKYVKVKMKLCEELGISVVLEQVDSNLADEVIFKKVEDAFNDPKVSGGLIQLPLPRESLEKCLDLIPSQKDVDLISSNNVDRYYRNDFSRLPPVVRAFNYFFNTIENTGDLSVEDVVAVPNSTAIYGRINHKLTFRILGNGFLVGKPLNHFLNTLGCATVNNEKYRIGDKITSDYLICGVGKPNMLNGQDISPNCNVIDFGTAPFDGKIVGDLDKNSSCSHLGTVSFSPGGIGPVVVRFLVINFLDLS